MSQLSPSKSSDHLVVLSSTAIRYLSYRPRFKAEVVNRLAQKAAELGIADPIALIDQIITSLEKSGFLNDSSMLESYIRTRLIEKVKGPYWIRPRLLHLGLSKSQVDLAIKKHASREIQSRVLEKYLYKTTHGVNLDSPAKARLIRRLLSRGFSYDLVNQLFDQRSPLE